MDCTALTFSRQSFHEYKTADVSAAQTVAQNNAASSPALIVSAADCRNGVENGDLCATLQAKSNGGFSLNCTHPVRIGAVVRRLTPKEAERLQGFPGTWTAYGHDDKPISDTKRYAAIGNSVAIPCVDYVLNGIVEVLK